MVLLMNSAQQAARHRPLIVLLLWGSVPTYALHRPPRVSYDQAKEGQKVGLNELRKGDLLFFSARDLEIGHVAIYAGNNKLLHTFSKERGVHFDTLDGKWQNRFVTARRLF